MRLALQLRTSCGAGQHTGLGVACPPPSPANELSLVARINQSREHAFKHIRNALPFIPAGSPASHTHLKASKVHGNQSTGCPGHAHHLLGKLRAVQAVPLAVQQAQPDTPVRGDLRMRNTPTHSFVLNGQLGGSASLDAACLLAGHPCPHLRG